MCVCVCVCVCVFVYSAEHALNHNSNSKYTPFSRGAIHRQTGNYSKAVDELLTAVDKCGGEGRGSRVYTASCRQLVLTYNDFAVQCFRCVHMYIHVFTMWTPNLS